MKDDYILNDRHQIHEIYKSLCTTCVYFDSFNYRCEAFPKGIPDKYLTGEAEHLQIDPEQVGETVYQKDKKFE